MASKIINRIRARDKYIEAVREANEAAKHDEERRNAKAALIAITAAVGLAAALSTKKKKRWCLF